MYFSAFAILLIAVGAVNGQSDATWCDSGEKYEDGLVCRDINECLTKNGGCDPDAICTNTFSSFRCACNPGYSGDGFTCNDIDECETNNGGCDPEANCTNTPGGFTCTCNSGYTGNGETCTDINECATNNGDCDPDATCTNFPGSFKCTCNPGFTGDGNNCTALPIALNFTLSGTERVYSLLSFNNQLFVARGEDKTNNQIQVYDNSNFEFVRHITISPTNPTTTSILEGLVISSDGSVLYVSDYTNNRVFVINLVTLTLTATWAVASGPRGLSINNEGNILVAHGIAMRIQEYTPSGTFVGEIIDTNYFWQALELIPGTLLVSRTTPVHDVCFMSTSGTVSVCYGSTPGSEQGHLNAPFSIALDAHDYVLVADSNNNRVMILNPSLSQGVPLPLPVGFDGPIDLPKGLSFDKSRARLFVGEDGGSYRVLVFDNIVNLRAYFN